MNVSTLCYIDFLNDRIIEFLFYKNIVRVSKYSIRNRKRTEVNNHVYPFAG